MTALSGSREGVTHRGLSSFFGAMFARRLNAAAERVVVKGGSNFGPYQFVEGSATGGTRVVTSTGTGLDGKPACDALATRDKAVVGYLGK